MNKQSGFSKWKRNRIIKNDLNNLALLRTKYSIVTTENNSLSTPSLAPAVNNSNIPPNGSVMTSLFTSTEPAIFATAIRFLHIARRVNGGILASTNDAISETVR